jgi:hypothetical protein
MDNDTIESLKQKIEEYRKELVKVLSEQGSNNDQDMVLRLSRELDELIVRYARITEKLRQNK